VKIAVVPLRGWNVFCHLPKDYDLKQLGIVMPRADVNRFRARFRAAAAFREIYLEGYSRSTVEGYSAFCRIMFVYSAFESFLNLIGKKPSEVSESLEKHGAIAVLNKLWMQDPDHSFYEFLHQRVNDRIRVELEQFAQVNPCNVALLAAAIRHIFAHGHLTPNVANGSPKRNSRICNTVSDFLLEYMSVEFEIIMKQIKRTAVC
jgi:hypothetical protein